MASSTNSIPSEFCSQKLWGLFFLALEPSAGVPGVRLGLLTPKIPLLSFYPPHVGIGPACSVAMPLLLAWTGMVSLIPSCQTSIQLNFWCFWWMFLHFSCYFDVVVGRGDWRLPRPLYWSAVYINFCFARSCYYGLNIYIGSAKKFILFFS